MSIFIKKLESYPNDLTIKQLITRVNLEDSIVLKGEENKVAEVKEEFKDSYFKSTEDTVFGKSTVILHIEKITSYQRTTDWDIIYTIKGVVTNLSTSFLSQEKLKGEGTGFLKTEYSLRKRTRISKKEYQEYLNKYEHIVSQIKNI